MTNVYHGSFPEINDEVMQEIESIEVENLGSAVLVFRNAVDVKMEQSTKWIDANAKKAHEQRWTYETDSAGNVYALNEDKNKFALEQLEEIPVRVLQPVVDDTEPEMVDLFRYWEDQIYKCLIKYVDHFPMVLPTLWWRSRGHIIRYDKGDYLGVHNDNDTNYRSTGGQRYIPKGQLGARQVLAVLVYINDCVKTEEELDGTNYMGGELYFPYLDIEYAAKAGDVVIFPCNFYATHGVKTVLAGNRYCYLEFLSQGSPDHNVLVNVVEPDECADWCYPHWMDNLYDDYKKYCLYIEHKKDKEVLESKPNPIFQNRALEGEEGLKQPYSHIKVYKDNELRGNITHKEADLI